MVIKLRKWHLLIDVQAQGVTMQRQMRRLTALGVLVAVALTTLMLLTCRQGPYRIVTVMPLTAQRCDNNVSVRRRVDGVGDSSQHCQKKERRETCERLLGLGSVVIPSDLQKECEAITEESSDWLELFKRFLRYVQWHRDVYDRIAKNLTTLQETRTLTFNCDIFSKCTGLGATVRSIATGVLAAMYTKRFFVADQLSYSAASCWTDLATPCNAFHWKVNSPTWDIFKVKVNVSTHVVQAAFNESNLHVFYGYPSIVHDEFFCDDMPEFERNSATSILCDEGLKQNTNEPLVGRKYTHFLLGAIARAAMHFSKAVSEQSNQKLVALRKKGLPSSSYLAMHLRTGLDEWVRNENKYRRTGKFIQGAANWRKHIDCALQKASASGLGRPILLVTDSSACREWTRAHYKPKDVLVTNSSFFHFSKVANQNYSCATHQAVQDMVSEIDVLSRASFLIPSGKSSFSEVAFYFSALPQSQLGHCHSPLINKALT